MGWIEIVATLFGILYLILLMRQNLWCWVAGNTSVALIAVSCYEAHLFADATLQVIYFALGVYGFVVWHRGDSRSQSLHMRKSRSKEWIVFTMSFLAGWALCYLLLSQVRSAALARVDSMLFAASLVATVMQARKLLENWLLWIPINIAYIAVYHMRDLDAYAGLSVLYAGMSAFGWYEWSKELAKQDIEQASSQ